MHDARRPAGGRKRPEPRRRRASGTPPPREQRAAWAAAVLAAALPGGRRGVRRAEIDGELYRLDVAIARAARVRSRSSGPALRAVRTFLAALRRANRPIGGLPEDLRLQLGLDAQIRHLEAYARFSGAEVEIVRGEPLLDEHGNPVFVVLDEQGNPALDERGNPVFGERGEPVRRVRDVVPKPRRPAPDAFAERLAAQAALRLCRLHGVAPTATKGGTACRLAAALHGNRTADLQKHVIAALKEAGRRRTET